MQERTVNVSPADTGCSMESPAPDQHDPHSSEEELEVINRNKEEIVDRPARVASVCLPEKRKWSQISGGARSNKDNAENMSPKDNMSPRSSCSPYQKEETAHHSGSSDDEVNKNDYIVITIIEKIILLELTTATLELKVSLWY